MSTLIKAGVIGHPIAHSLSPKLHNYWLEKYNINGEYKAYDVAPESLEYFIRSMLEKGFAGCNVTIPHKEAVMEFMDEVDVSAKAIGAVNTIVVENGRLLGKNTDALGFLENIAPRLTMKKKAVILGAGGAARAVVFALQFYGIGEIIITNRTRERSEELKKYLSSFNSLLKIDDWGNRSDSLEDADLLVNTTSLGLQGNPPLEMDLSLLPPTALVTDIVYKPLITPLLAAAKERGNPIVDGLGMLLHQAAPGFAAWFLDNKELPEVTQELRDYILSA